MEEIKKKRRKKSSAHNFFVLLWIYIMNWIKEIKIGGQITIDLPKSTKKLPTTKRPINKVKRIKIE